MFQVMFVFVMVSIGIFLTSAAVSVSAYAVSQKKSLLYLSILLFAYSLESIVVFSEEFSLQNIAFSSEAFLYSTQVIPRILLASLQLQMLWLVICEFFRIDSKIWRFLPVVIFLILSLVSSLVLIEPVMRWVVYSLRQFFCIFVILFCLIKTLGSSYKEVIKKQTKTIVFISVFALFVVLTLIEDTVVMLIARPEQFVFIPGLAEFLYNRNVAETLTFVVIAVYTMYLALRTFMLKSGETPSSKYDKISLKVEEILPLFASRYGLTNRETDILRYLIQDFDNQKIAADLYLALSTVKCHVHNILKKTNTHNRKELLDEFWTGN